MRRAARKDGNHRRILDALEADGCVVVDVSGTACGLDAFVWWRAWFALEIKDEAQPPSARRLTDIERKLQNKCIAAGAQHAVVINLADARRVVGITT